jgi:ADP-dependent NAD(P)H-hydrate dehydratase / NAD(P)H-hydrate epimerase
MQPVLSVEELNEVDRRATEQVALSVLIGRAGAAVASRALVMLGGSYARRVVVVAGRGHNGDDGRVAAQLLRRRGVLVSEIAPGAAEIPPCDLVIDAAFGTGFHGDYRPPAPPRGAKVLAVDIPSGLDADLGVDHGAGAADETVTFCALKPGLLLGAGPALAGALRLAPIGLDPGEWTMGLVEDGDLAQGLPRREREAHKWRSAVLVLAGSPPMRGAALLAARGALRSGAGMVRLAIPGAAPGVESLPEAVGIALPQGVDEALQVLLAELGRCRALVVGPGLGREEATGRLVRELVRRSPVPVVVDADALFALGELRSPLESAAPVLLTPHDGEFARLAGHAPGERRAEALRALVDRSGATVLLKGPTTLVASPGGTLRFCTSGSPALATAGSGDVLSGVIAALVARGLDLGRAAALGAHLHGRAAGRCGAEGLLAGDLPEAVAAHLSALPGAPS